MQVEYRGGEKKERNQVLRILNVPPRTGHSKLVPLFCPARVKLQFAIEKKERSKGIREFHCRLLMYTLYSLYKFHRGDIKRLVSDSRHGA